MGPVPWPYAALRCAEAPNVLEELTCLNCLNSLSHESTFIAIAKMEASDTSIQTVPCVITDSAPLVVDTDLHSSL